MPWRTGTKRARWCKRAEPQRRERRRGPRLDGDRQDAMQDRETHHRWVLARVRVCVCVCVCVLYVCVVGSFCNERVKKMAFFLLTNLLSPFALVLDPVQVLLTLGYLSSPSLFSSVVVWALIIHSINTSINQYVLSTQKETWPAS
ncbi:hypothetical protein LZ31DRAFT_339272 [Colletotrichum somersetense]|nr:hypothetical protein LZ31DRAFT_339272 [Colletotrichum somersetense]